MKTEPAWSTSRWGMDQQHYYPPPPPRQAHQQRTPAPAQSHHSQVATELSAPAAINPMSRSVLVEPSAPSWPGRSQQQIDTHSNYSRPTGVPAAPDYYTERPHHSRSGSRPSPPASGNFRPQPVQPAAHSYGDHSVTAPRHDISNDYKQSAENDQRPIDTPLTLHIPHNDLHTSQDPPKTTPARLATPHDILPYSRTPSTTTPQTTSLPSFARFQQSATRPDDSDEVEIAPMSSRLSCYDCTKLKPLVSEVAIRVAELDENIQTYCNNTITRTLDFPQDCSIRAAEWILDRLRNAKGDLQTASRRQQTPRYYQPTSATFSNMFSHRESPSNALKRRVERWDDYNPSKRARGAESPDDPNRMPSTLSIKDDRRPSMELAMTPKETFARPGYSPPASESAPGSAFPMASSPGRQARALPSPSSIAYPPSAAPSLAPVNVGSPPPFSQASSIHAASSNPATSAHIADLQHQVTLKSLALQTLQSEYASLLHKLQRERVKSQTIERKTTVADQEVNDLTSKNEELTDQVKLLQKQVEDSEKKREDAYAEAKREKDQWGRMLEMSGRLQNKHADEKQKLIEENEILSKKILAAEGKVHSDESNGTGTHSQGAGISATDIVGLRSENALLKSRLDILRRAMEDAQSHNADVLRLFQAQSGRMGAALDEVFPQRNEVLHTNVASAIARTDDGTPLASLSSQTPQHAIDALLPAPISAISVESSIANAPPERQLGNDHGKADAVLAKPIETEVNRFASFRPLQSPSTPCTDVHAAVPTTKSTPVSSDSSPGANINSRSPSVTGESSRPSSTPYIETLREDKAPSLRMATVLAHSAPYIGRDLGWHHVQAPQTVMTMPPPPRRI